VNVKTCDVCHETKLRHFWHSHEWRKASGICMGCAQKAVPAKARFKHHNHFGTPIGYCPNWDYERGGVEK